MPLKTMLAPSRPAMAERPMRSRVSRLGAAAKEATRPRVSGECRASTAEVEVCAIESSQGANRNSGLAKRRGRPKKRKESPTADMDDDPTNNVRRNPKRKATEAASAATSAAAAEEARDPWLLLREALRPIDQEELQEWEGWCEVESEPAFFNAMLREMGVKDVKVQEVFSVDEDYVATLPQPVFGFIFLYQYFPEAYHDDEVVDGRDLWFANQTTDNACATVALTNILMNSDDIDLGEKLEEFKAATKGLSTPLRGHALSSNTFIRSVHNSFTRRMDHLNADLFLENEASESKKKKQRAPSKKKTKKQKIDSESGFHFIAYVPANGSVWELDGLKTRPVCLGPLVDRVHWTNIVRPNIQARMLQFEESALQFNLLAICKSPLASISQSLASSIRSFELLGHRTRGLAGWDDLIDGNEQPLRGDEHERISGFGLKPADIDRAQIDPNFERKVKNPSLEMMELFELYSELVTQQKSQIGEYIAEIASEKEDEDRVQGRKKDHTQAIHCWVQKLADHGVLVDWTSNS